MDSNFQTDLSEPLNGLKYQREIKGVKNFSRSNSFLTTFTIQYDSMEMIKNVLSKYELKEGQQGSIAAYLTRNQDLQPHLLDLRQAAGEFFPDAKSFRLTYWKSPEDEEESLSVYVRMPELSPDQAVDMDLEFYNHYLDAHREFFPRLTLIVTSK